MSRTGDQRHARQPFTLVEVLLAVLVLAIGLGGVLAAYTKAAGTIRAAQDNVEAFLLLKEKMAELELQYRRTLALVPGRFEGEFEEPFQYYTWETEVRPGPDQSLLEVSAMVRQQNSGRQVSVATYFPAPSQRRTDLPKP
jgi:Tfp pilus assembly protein PilV